MVCPFCNSPVNQDTAFCPACGRHISGKIKNPEASYYPQTGSNYPSTGYSYPPTGSTYPSQYSYPPSAPSAVMQPDLPMKWYNWLKVVLIIGAVWNFISVLTYIGKMGELSQFTPLQYALIPGLEELVGTMRFVLVFMCIYSLAFGIFNIYVQRQLVGFKKNAPKMIVLMYTISAVVGAVASILLAAQMEEVFRGGIGMSAQIDSYYASAIGEFVVGMLFAGLNSKYFKKRAHLFVN